MSSIDQKTQNGHRWICCQIGAREHYSIPRALLRRGLLDELITDVWATPGSLISLGNRGLRNRFDDSLTNTKVRAANVRSIMFELRLRARRRNDGWKLITERNDWFQRFAVSQLRRRSDSRDPITVFAYSYAARLIFKFARQQGWKTVLGQIDPGPVEETIVQRATSGDGNDGDDFGPAPPDYWNQWRSEVELADSIVVNSRWSQEALIADGIPSEKIKVIPLAFEKPQAAIGFERNYPERFTAARPLRVLFLGQVNPRKGLGALFDAIRIVKDEFIEFWFVGSIQVTIPSDVKDDNRVKWFESVPRDRVGHYYRDADVFVFPTLSDGFGLTQLEAQSWKLPLVASRNCAEVVKDGVTGLVLEDVSGPSIAEALLTVYRSPEILERMSAQSDLDDEFSLNRLASSLVSL